MALLSRRPLTLKRRERIILRLRRRHRITPRHESLVERAVVEPAKDPQQQGLHVLPVADELAPARKRGDRLPLLDLLRKASQRHALPLHPGEEGLPGGKTHEDALIPELAPEALDDQLAAALFGPRTFKLLGLLGRTISVMLQRQEALQEQRVVEPFAYPRQQRLHALGLANKTNPAHKRRELSALAHLLREASQRHALPLDTGDKRLPCRKCHEHTFVAKLAPEPLDYELVALLTRHPLVLKRRKRIVLRLRRGDRIAPRHERFVQRAVVEPTEDSQQQRLDMLPLADEIAPARQ